VLSKHFLLPSHRELPVWEKNEIIHVYKTPDIILVFPIIYIFGGNMIHSIGDFECPFPSHSLYLVCHVSVFQNEDANQMYNYLALLSAFLNLNHP